ncbi:ABC transporter six-transmembrane domain-containing protein [Endozoicomonas sp. OPT23]|uniref:ABC transporter six-transmembrane domain-containing protein n=1 Tax=Endozoicomonas sp. OPT23 TaxID=2072845 RepID=UPI001891A4EB|nr:ABC transporter six-transmembrane domain-containing protein [Endozoicomonas sp. OPT23]
MELQGRLTLVRILREFWKGIAVTWSMVLVENLLLALMPLALGYSIDGLIMDDSSSPLTLEGLLTAYSLVMVARRFHYTRAYGRIRISLGLSVERRHQDHSVSVRSARMDMSRELVDFLEQEVPDLITAVVHIGVAIVVLASFSLELSLSAVVAGIIMVGVYSLFHNRIHFLNNRLNTQVEKQVNLLEMGKRRPVINHLMQLNRHEIHLSDVDALMGGIILSLPPVFC